MQAMARFNAAAAICTSLVIAAMSAGTAEAKAAHRGFIRMQDGLFVDQECREFNFVGANACVLQTAGLPDLQPNTLSLRPDTDIEE